MASPRPPAASIAAKQTGYKAEKGVDIRAATAQKRNSTAGFAGVGPTADEPAAAVPSPRAPTPRGPGGVPKPPAATAPVQQPPPPPPAAAVANTPSKQSAKDAKPSAEAPAEKPKHTGRLLGPQPQKKSSGFWCCRSNDVDEESTALSEAEVNANDMRGPPEDVPAAKAPMPVKKNADDDGSPAKSAVSAMAKLDESKLVRKQSVLNQPEKPPTPSTAAARSASFRGGIGGLNLSGSLQAAGSNPASPSALDATDRPSPSAMDRPSPAGGLRRLSSKSTLQQQQATSLEGGIRRAPSFTAASPAVSPASGVEATPSPVAFRSDSGDMVKQVSLVARKSSFVMPSAQQSSALPPRPSPSIQSTTTSNNTNNENPPPLKGLGARPSSASGELQKSKKSNIVSGVSGASPSPPRDEANASPGIGRARASSGAHSGDVLGDSNALSMSASLGRAPRPPRPINV